MEELTLKERENIIAACLEERYALPVETHTVSCTMHQRNPQCIGIRCPFSFPGEKEKTAWLCAIRLIQQGHQFFRTHLGQ